MCNLLFVSVELRSTSLIGPEVLPFLVALACLASPHPASAQADTLPAPVPFGPGEEVRYKVKVGIFSIGEAIMRIPRIDTIRGVPAYAIEWTIDGGFPGFRIRDRFFSWVDTRTLASLRFKKETHNGTERRELDLFPEERRWQRLDIDSAGVLPSSLPLDDVSFVYHARTLHLQPGTTQRFDRFYEEEANPILLHVIRRDTREVGAGEFETIVIRPVIRNTGLFAEDANSEIHVSDDHRRLIVYMKADLPLVNLTFHLEEIVEGVPLRGGGGRPKPPDGDIESPGGVGCEAAGHGGDGSVEVRLGTGATGHGPCADEGVFR